MISSLFFILVMSSLARADVCPDLNGTFLACVSSQAEDSQAKEFVIHQEGSHFQFDSLNSDDKLTSEAPFVADGSLTKSPDYLLKASCEGNSLVEQMAWLQNGNPILQLFARYSLSDQNHLQLDVYLDPAAAKPAKTIRCVRFN